MAEYIDKSEIYRRFFDGGNGIAHIHASDIDVIPAADVAPVVHGRWIKSYEDCDLCHECSLCGKPALLDGNEREVLSPWCPHCGAKMDLE